jgi:hypothetical protein
MKKVMFIVYFFFARGVKRGDLRGILGQKTQSKERVSQQNSRKWSQNWKK